MSEMSTRPAPSTAGASATLSRLAVAHRAITAEFSPAALPGRIVDAARLLFETDGAGFALVGRAGEVTGWAGDTGIGDRVRTVDGAWVQRMRRANEQGLLSAPVRVRGETYGELFVDSAAGSADDGALLFTFAEIAGTAVDNALLYEEARRAKDWLRASGEIARGLLAGSGADALFEMVERALQVADADCSSVIVPTANGMLRVGAVAGAGSEEFSRATFDPALSQLATAVTRGQSLIVQMNEVMAAGYENPYGFGPLMAAPIVDARGVRGSLVLCRSRGKADFTARDLDLATIFADQMALAFEMDDARMRGEWMSVLEDRHRIGKDLHDNVMQRLFAIGVGLQSLPAPQLAPEIARRMGRYITDLDETIDEIRHRVFGLQDDTGDDAAEHNTRFPRFDRIREG